jgi:hypothetical protein
MREIKITVTVNQEGQSRKFADTEYRYRIEVDGELSEMQAFHFCRHCLNGGGIAYEEWKKDMDGLQDKNDDISTYFNGYYKFSQSIISQDANGVVTKAVYDYSVTIPYCD